MATLDELRQLAQRRHDAATRKASRLRKQGVEVTGTQYDPRRQRANIGKYNRRQLQSYIRDLDKFTDRNTRFVGGARGTPIPRETWVRFERAQTAINRRAERYARPHLDRVLPTTGTTVGQRLSDRGAAEFNVLRMGRGLSNLPLAPSSFRPQDFVSPEAVKKMDRTLRSKLRPNYVKQRVKSARVAAGKMLDTIGDQELANAVKELSDDEMDLLWNFTGMPESTSLRYKMVQSGMPANMVAQVEDDTAAESWELISWVRQQRLR